MTRVLWRAVGSCVRFACCWSSNLDRRLPPRHPMILSPNLAKVANSGVTMLIMVSWCSLVFCSIVVLVGQGYAQNTTRGPATGTTVNSECVILGVDADGFLERIDPRKFLLVDNEQKSFLQRACENYKKMRSLPGCVPKQQNSIYDYACDTVLEMAAGANTAACWSRTTSCSLVKLLPPTDSITAAYCKFLTAVGLQMGCALELTPACETPTNAAVSQAAARGRSFLDTFQCAVLSPISGGQLPVPAANATGRPSVEVIGAQGGEATTTTEEPAEEEQTTLVAVATRAPGGPRRKTTEPPLPLNGKLPDCDFGQNARGLMCAANLLGVQDKFSETSGSLIFQELAKNSSTELAQVCGQFDTYHDCMVKQVYQSDTRTCLTKSHVHDFSWLFYAFCDPANQERIQRIRPCVQKLMTNTETRESTAFQLCRDHLTTMRAQVRVIIKDNQNSLALCRGMLAAESFFDCIPPVVAVVCDQQSVTDLAHFREWVASNIETVGCPVNDPRVANYSVGGAPAAPTAAPVQLVTALASTPSTSTAGNVLVKSATIAIVESEESASTVKVDEAMPAVARMNSLGEKCSDEDIRRFLQCYANISDIDLDPFTIIKRPDQLEAVCEAFAKYQDCRDSLDCTPPAGDGVNNMLGFFCADDGADFKKYRTCLQQASQTTPGRACAQRVLPRNLLAMDTDQSCVWSNEVINCSYNEAQSRCSIEAADFTFKIWQGFAKGINITCPVELPSASNDTILGSPISCTPAEEEVVDQCIEPFNVITDRLASLIEGGLQAFMRAMRRITEVFKAGCDTRVGFDDCMRKNLVKGSPCHVSSCLIKVTEYACNFSGDSDMTLEDRLKCMWSMIGEPEFGKCLKLFPKNAFANINRLRLYLPRFVNCLEAPLLRKCGQTTLNLVKALSSQSSSDPNDQTCVVMVPGLNDGNASRAVIGANVTTSRPTAGGSTRGGVPAVVIPGVGAGATTSRVVLTTTAAPVDKRPVCKTPEDGVKVERCHMLLNNRTSEPLPLKVFNSPDDLDTACNAYKAFSDCTRALPCHIDFTSATQEVLLRVCTVRYQDYKASAACLIQFADGPRGGECTAPLYRMNLSIPQIDGGRAVCQATTNLMACITPDLSNSCNDVAVGLVYDLQTAFAKQFKPDCVVKAPVQLVPGTECTGVEVGAFEACTSESANYTVNPISIINDPSQFGEFCTAVQQRMQPCLGKLACSPEPYAHAYNDSLAYACTSDDFRTKYDKYKSCLSTATNTPAVQQCLETYKSIVWYGGDDPRGNPARACKSVTSMLTCVAPELSQRCEPEAVRFVFEWNQRMISKVQSDCKLVIPADLPAKLNFTTTAEPPTTAKTTPAKGKDTDGTTGRPSGATCTQATIVSSAITLVTLVVLRFY